MELALYWPGGGYYTHTSTNGTPLDYFTAPAAHPVFGALLAIQLEEMWRLLGRPHPFVVVEPGAGSGQLAYDINSYALNLGPSFSDALSYVTIDRSTEIAPIASDASPFHRIMANGIPLHNVTGCVLSNELLDALPVHRVIRNHGRLQEIYVTYSGGKFLEIEDEPSTPSIASQLEEGQVILEEGQRAEVCLALDSWIQQVAAALKRGFVLTIDYGHHAQELYSPQKLRGTLRCYYKHTLSSNPYVNVGDQDITAHVDFTAIETLGTKYGLRNESVKTQASFLNNVGLRIFQQRLATSGLDQREQDANRMAMLDLSRPGGMGDFKVLVQGKDVANPAITGINGSSEQWKKRMAGLPLPILDANHLSLMEARYPHTAQTWEESWPWQ